MVNSSYHWFVLSCLDFSDSMNCLCSCGVETLSDPHSPTNCQLTRTTCHITTKHTVFFIPCNNLFLSFIPLLFYNSTDNNAGSQDHIHDFGAIYTFEGACGGTVDRGTVLHAARLQVQFLIVSLEFLIDLFLQAVLGAWDRLSP